MPDIRGGHAVVLGASMAGLMAARVLSEFYERVTVVERDVLPAAAEHRRGVPQSRHLHVLLARGASILEDLFPGFVSDAVDAGASTADALARVRLMVSGHRLLQTDAKGFDAFAASLRFPDIFEAVRDGEPLHDPVGFRYPANVRHRYERMRSFPEGFLVLGDAVCAFNPVYGQGMTSAAMQAEAMRAVLAEDRALTWQRCRRALSRAVDPAWQISAGGDLAFSGVVGHRTPLIRTVNAYLPRVHAAAARDPEVSVRFIRVASLVDRPEALLRPGTALRVLGRRARKSVV